MKFFVILITALLLSISPVQSAKEGVALGVACQHIPTPVTLIVNQEDIEEIIKKPIKPEVDIPLSEELQKHIWKMCEKYGISYELVLSIIAIESEFKSKAVSYNKTSLGLMQLNKNTYPTLAKELKIDNFDPFNAKHNSRAGIYYLSKIREDLIEKGWSDEEIVSVMLITYNRGKLGARKYISRNGVNSKYVDKIMEKKYIYERE